MIEVGSKAPEVTLLDTDGRSVELSEIVGRGPAVLFFLRHYA